MKFANTALLVSLLVTASNLSAVAQTVSEPQQLHNKFFSFVFPAGLSAMTNETVKSSTKTGNDFSIDECTCSTSSSDAAYLTGAITYSKPLDISKDDLISMRDAALEKAHCQLLRETFASFDGCPGLTFYFKTNDGTFYGRQRLIIANHYLAYEIGYISAKEADLDSADADKAFNSFKPNKK